MQDAAVLTDGSFATSFILADTITKGNKDLAIRADVTNTDADFAKTSFTVNVDAVIRDFYTTETGTDKVTSVNNAIQNTGVWAEIHGFETGADAAASPDIKFTYMDSEGESVTVATFTNTVTAAAQRIQLTILQGAPAGDLTITATQDDTTAMKDLKVVTPTITLSPMSADNSMAVEVTATGSNFGDGSSALTFGDLTIAVTAKDANDNDVAVADVTPDTADFTATTGTTPHSHRTLLSRWVRNPGEITIKVTVATSYMGMANLMLSSATPAQVMSVALTPVKASCLSPGKRLRP